MRALTFSLNVLPDNLQADINISGQLCIFSYNVIEEQWPATVDVNCIGEYFFFFFLPFVRIFADFSLLVVV